MLVKANEKQRENTAWELYLTIYPYMTEDKFVSFEDFYSKTTLVKEKTEEEILADVKNIIDNFNSKGR